MSGARRFAATRWHWLSYSVLAVARRARCRRPAASVRSNSIDHVVIILQENRSFDNLFQGYPGADTQSYGYNSKGQKVVLKPIGLSTTWDLEHSFSAFLASCNGKGTFPGTQCRMNGFDKDSPTCGGQGEPPCPTRYPPIRLRAAR